MTARERREARLGLYWVASEEFIQVVGYGLVAWVAWSWWWQLGVACAVLAVLRGARAVWFVALAARVAAEEAGKAGRFDGG